jgi:hypothetical protein
MARPDDYPNNMHTDDFPNDIGDIDDFPNGLRFQGTRHGFA